MHREQSSCAEPKCNGPERPALSPEARRRLLACYRLLVQTGWVERKRVQGEEGADEPE